MVVHEDGDLNRPGNWPYWWQNGCFQISGATIKDVPMLVPIIAGILDDERQIVKELTGVRVLRRELSGLYGSSFGRELERDRKWFHLGILGHRLRFHPAREC